jgi:hypothetical protein
MATTLFQTHAANDILRIECANSELRKTCGRCAIRIWKNRLTMKRDNAPAQERDSVEGLSFLIEPGTNSQIEHLPSDGVEKLLK